MRKIEPFQIKKIYAIGNALGITKRGGGEDELHALIQGMTGKESIKALTSREASAAPGTGCLSKAVQEKRKGASRAAGRRDIRAAEEDMGFDV